MNKSSSTGVYKHDIVQEVLDGEETPMTKDKNYMKKMSQVKQYATVTPLFHLPEGSINHETI